MKQKIKFILALINVLFLMSCNTITSDSTEIEKFVENEENKVKQIYESGDLKIVNVFYPASYFYAKIYKGDSLINKDSLQKAAANCFYQNIRVSIQGRDVAGIMKHNEMLDLGSLYQSMGQKIYLLQDGDTLRCVDAFADNYYGMGEATEFYLLYKDLKPKDFRVKIESINEAIAPRIDFDYEYSKLKAIPELIIK
jgi:hypothetical protein